MKFHLQQVQSQAASSCATIYKGVRTPVEFVDDVLSKVTSTMKEIGTFSREELVTELKHTTPRLSCLNVSIHLVCCRGAPNLFDICRSRCQLLTL